MKMQNLELDGEIEKMLGKILNEKEFKAFKSGLRKLQLYKNALLNKTEKLAIKKAIKSGILEKILK